MIKTILKNILMYISALVFFNGPLLLYEYTSPLYLMWIAPFYLVFVNILCDLKLKSKICIWRIIPSGIIIAIGYFIDIVYLEWYFQTIFQDKPDPFTYLLGNYFYLISFIIVIVSICIYQCLIIGVIIFDEYNKKRSRKINSKTTTVKNTG